MVMKDEDTATVRVAEGQLRGRRVESKAGGTFWSFQGIPYARPPVGPLRFKDAQPAEPWIGVRNAFKEGNNCSQFNWYTNEYTGSEDCLFLNVYSPQLHARGEETLAVMVFIHPGGFDCGSGDSNMYGPDYLLAEDVILVTINYRVGVLGFLFLDEAAPGNVGMKDQVAALRWVQRNIAAFGGDPGNVTLFGTSAGAASVHLHMYSPLTEGLFHRAIAMGGAALGRWARQTDPADTTRRLARLLGCTSDDPHAIVDFLRTVDHMELVRVARTKAVPEKDKGRIVNGTFVLTEERIVPGVETYLPAPIERLIREGRHHDVSFMTGITDKEGLMVLAYADIQQKDVADDVDSRWQQTILPELRIPPDDCYDEAALIILRQFFMKGKSLQEDTLDGFIDLFGDIYVTETTMHALNNIAKKSNKPIYQYQFAVDDQLNVNKLYGRTNLPGACHGDEKGYLFHSPVYNIDVAADSLAALARRRMVRLWTNFAKTGDPTPNDDPLLGVRWKPYSLDEKNFLEIGHHLSNGKNLLADRISFWEAFYKNFGI